MDVGLCIPAQALYRALTVRREYAQMVARKNVLRRLEEAASSGRLDTAKEALALAGNLGKPGRHCVKGQGLHIGSVMDSCLRSLILTLTSIGLGAEAQARVSAMEEQAEKASQRLMVAAAEAPFHAYQTAVDAARRFPHLSALIQESERVFAMRRTQAEDLLHIAVQSRPIQVR